MSLLIMSHLQDFINKVHVRLDRAYTFVYANKKRVDAHCTHTLNTRTFCPMYKPVNSNDVRQSGEKRVLLLVLLDYNILPWQSSFVKTTFLQKRYHFKLFKQKMQESI
ncbi:MAG: hypothetical protein C6W58_01930 [Bacillaceae bacterium]|nr:hypothetical protein A3Q35_08260 [Aeribacillus pallidus]REJ20718.1 MAG: hypothetical protein C6W58_01930 [Bacillaceae bacterium]REJ23480.1 MAG: hypothetical protein C6W54_09780 [Bacillaceae bacterium]